MYPPKNSAPVFGRKNTPRVAQVWKYKHSEEPNFGWWEKTSGTVKLSNEGSHITLWGRFLPYVMWWPTPRGLKKKAQFPMKILGLPKLSG